MLDHEKTGIVFNIQKFSVHDGEGIRTLVFLKGCPLHCAWCCNPESQKFQPERAFNPMRCLTAAECGRCAQACPTKSISVIDNCIAYNPAACTSCGKCVHACPTGAQSFYGESLRVEDILNRVEEDDVFYHRSGGGLTISGGEALAQPEFTLALLREAKKRRIHTTIETCGHYPTAVLDEACPLLDALIMDIKTLDNAKHKQFTGVGNEQILKNVQHVIDTFPTLPVRFRTPIIPTFNDSHDDIMAIRKFIPLRPQLDYEILTYHRLGQPKYGYLGRSYSLEGLHADETFMATMREALAQYTKQHKAR